VKKLAYKFYVLLLLCLVFWAGQLFYSLIYWDFEVKQTNTAEVLKGVPSEMALLKKLRGRLSTEPTKEYHLGDISIKEHYETGHFHHVGGMLKGAALNGCDYCHTNMAHKKGEEVRAFRNMHSYFVACETCHFINQFKPEDVEHGWMDVYSREATIRPVKLDLSKPKIEFDNGMGRLQSVKIIPWLKRKQDRGSIIDDSKIEEAKKLLNSYQEMGDVELRAQLSHMHRGLTRKPFKCDDCHSKKKSAISYARLGYSAQDSKRLMDIAIAALVSEYNKFHFPDLFIRKDERKRSKNP